MDAWDISMDISYGCLGYFIVLFIWIPDISMDISYGCPVLSMDISYEYLVL
jgi:hypothetical protein